MLTKEQNEIVAFINDDFRKVAPDVNDRRKMFEVLRLVAKMRWPDEDWGPCYNSKI